MKPSTDRVAIGAPTTGAGSPQTAELVIDKLGEEIVQWPNAK